MIMTIENKPVDATPDLAVQRVRQPPKLRMLQVLRKVHVGQTLLRVTLTGDELAGFTSAGFDDHVKLFFPTPGQLKPVIPQMGPNGPMFEEGMPRPVMRDFTPRRYDAASNELDIEFFLHEAGPASDWARNAQLGDYLGVGGPRRSFIIPDGFDWKLLIADETGLPAVGRRLEEWQEGEKLVIFIEVADARYEIPLPAKPGVEIHWVHRTPTRVSALETAVRRFVFPVGQCYVWAAGESAQIRAIRQYLTQDRGVEKSRIRASGYWKAGAEGVHESFKD
jgi:NADPH-dependent ferric siderophore reductase